MIYHYIPSFKPLPIPTGPAAIGTKLYYIEDATRPETHDLSSKDMRKLKIQVWYPAIEDNQHTPWYYLADVTPDLKKAFEKEFWGLLPDTLVTKMLSMKTHANVDALPAVKAGPYPVILFSHGFGASAGWYTSYIEELASQGYVVVGVNHTYSTNYVQFPDGRVIEFNQEGILQDNEKCHAELAVWVADQRFVIDWLEKAQNDDPVFKDMLNLQKIGVAGHSFGGVTALQTCRLDSRCIAAVNLDGNLSVLEKELEQPFPKPSMWMMQDHNRAAFVKKLGNVSEEENAKYRAHLMNVFQHNADLVYMILLEGAAHSSFSDMVLIKYPLAQFLGLYIGEIEPYFALRMVNQYLVVFFDFYLKGIRSSVLLEQLKKGEINYVG